MNSKRKTVEADLAAERCVANRIRRRFPGHGILAEESGYRPGSADFTWVIDPLDGTSNFVAGLPWFGVMIALLHEARPILAVMHLPASNTLYEAELGSGAKRDGSPVHVTRSRLLSRRLIAYGMDATRDAAMAGRQAAVLVRLVNRARNVRATNSLIDFAWTIDGRLGGVINQACRIWDIAAPALILREAGGRLTDLEGRELDLEPGPTAAGLDYAVVGASPALHRQLLEVIQDRRLE